MRAGEQHTGREMLKDLHALGSSFKDFKTRQTVTRGHRKTISGGNMENRAMNEILFKDQEEDEYLKFQNDEELINTKLSEELRLMLELPPLVDPEISEKTMSLFEDTFSGYMNVIKDGLYLLLEDMADVNEIQQRIREGRVELVNQCFQYLCKYYATLKPKAVKALERLRLLSIQRSGGAVSNMPSSGWVPLSLSASTNEEGFLEEADIPKTWRDKITWRNARRLVYRRIPILKWAPQYYRNFWNKIASDALGAITIAFILVPLGLSYAQIASLPPVYGLYASFFPPMIYMLFGTSAELAVGPASVISLFVPSIAGSFGAIGTQGYIDGALFMAMYSGVLLFIAGILNIGNIIANLLSQPVLSAFMTGAAIIIIMGQLNGLMAIPVSGDNVVDLSNTFWNNIQYTDPWTFFLGFICVMTVLSMKYISPRLPIAFVVLFLTTLVSWQLELNTVFGMSIVGDVPSGLPSPSWLSALSWSAIQDNITDALTIALIGYVESIAVAKKYAARRRYRIDVNQELFALGMCNIVGSLFQCYPVTGSLSRTATNFVCGVKTQLSSFFVSLFLGITLLLFTSAFYYTPTCVLAAIVIAFTVSLLDFSEFFYLLRILAFIEVVEYFFVLVVTLLLGPVVGVIVSVVVSLFHVVYRSTKPPSSVMGRLPGTVVYKDVQAFPKAETVDGVLVLKYDASLFFANINWFWDLLIKHEVKNRKQGTPLNAVVTDWSSILMLDSTAIQILTEIIQDYEDQGTLFVVANVKDRVKATLDASKLTNKIGEANFFPSTHEAVQYIVSILDREERDRKAMKRKKKRGSVIGATGTDPEDGEGTRVGGSDGEDDEEKNTSSEERRQRKKKKLKKPTGEEFKNMSPMQRRRLSLQMGQAPPREAMSDRALIMKNVKESWASFGEFKDATSKKVQELVGGMERTRSKETVNGSAIGKKKTKKSQEDESSSSSSEEDIENSPMKKSSSSSDTEDEELEDFSRRRPQDNLPV